MSEIVSIIVYIYLAYLSFKFIFWAFNLTRTKEDKIELIEDIRNKPIQLTNAPDIKLSDINKKTNKIKDDYKFTDLLVKEKKQKHKHISVSVNYV